MNKSLLFELLKAVYPNDLGFLKDEVDKLSAKYKLLIHVDDVKLSHKDAILITYADAIYEQDKKPLNTLKLFYDKYLKNVISGIHLLPCFPYTSDDGFSVVDYYTINPEYGDWSSIASLNESVELMFDAVINHTSKSSAWFEKFKTNTPPYHNYFIEANPDEDFSKVVRPRALPLLHSYKKQNEEIFLWTTFSEDQLDLNFKSPHVFLQILDILLFYLSKGARFIRLDAIAFLWKKKHTTCIHLPETHAIIQAYRLIIERIAPQAIIITETNVPHAENISYFGNGTNEAHMVYNFTLPPLLAYSIHNQDVSVFVKWAKTLQPENQTNCFFNFTASHDGIGVRPLQGIIPDHEIAALAERSIAHGGKVSYKNNEDGTKSPYELNCNYFELLSHPKEPEEVRINKFILSQAIMLTMPGIPGIYYHSIVGSLNFIQGVEESGINRRINRQKLEFKALEKDLENSNSLRGKVYRLYHKFLGIRVKEPIFNPYGKATYSIQNDALYIERIFKNKKLLAIFNVNEFPVILKLSDNNAYDLVEEQLVKGDIITLSPWGFKWIKFNL